MELMHGQSKVVATVGKEGTKLTKVKNTVVITAWNGYLKLNA